MHSALHRGRWRIYVRTEYARLRLSLFVRCSCFQLIFSVIWHFNFHRSIETTPSRRKYRRIHIFALVIKCCFAPNRENDWLFVQHWWWLFGGIVPRIQVRHSEAVGLLEFGSMRNAWRFVAFSQFFLRFLPSPSREISDFRCWAVYSLPENFARQKVQTIFHWSSISIFVCTEFGLSSMRKKWRMANSENLVIWSITYGVWWN